MAPLAGVVKTTLVGTPLLRTSPQHLQGLGFRVCRGVKNPAPSAPSTPRSRLLVAWRLELRLGVWGGERWGFSGGEGREFRLEGFRFSTPGLRI